MDQPGMLAPWKQQGLSYTDGINNFLHINNIKTIIMSKPNCERPETNTYSGWAELMQIASVRNERAMCGLISKYSAKNIGPFTVLVLTD